MAQYKDYSDFLKNFEDHREKHETRSHLLREEGWKDLNKKFGSEFDYWQDVEKMNEDKYNSHGTKIYYEGYWDSKANDMYYSQPISTRAWLTLKKVGWFYRDTFVIWGVFGTFLVLHSAKSTSKSLNSSSAYTHM